MRATATMDRRPTDIPTAVKAAMNISKTPATQGVSQPHGENSPPKAVDPSFVPDPFVSRKLREFYQTVVSPPPISLLHDRVGFEKYEAHISARVEAILHAYKEEVRALHVDLLERYGSSPFVSDDVSPRWAATKPIGNDSMVQSHHQSLSSMHDHQRQRNLSPMQDDFNRPSIRENGWSVVGCYSEQLELRLLDGGSATYVSPSGRARLPQQVQAVKHIWDSLRPVERDQSGTLQPEVLRGDPILDC